MNALVVYASKYGATEQIARRIAEGLGEQSTLCDVHKEKPSLAPYDTVVLGGPIYMGMADKKLSAFLKANEQVLLQKRLGLFVGGATPPDTPDYVEKFFSPELLNQATAVDALGGLMQKDKLNFMFRKIVEKIEQSEDGDANFVDPKIEEARIARFVEALRAE